MKIEFKFNSKSSGQNVPEAISVAKQCGGTIENQFYKIEFNDPKDKNLEELYELVGNLKGTTISIDGEESVNASKFFKAINCPDQFLCNGVCKHCRIGYSFLGDFKEEYSQTIEDNVLLTSNDGLIRSLTNFLELKQENQFAFNKKLFLDHFRQETLMESRFCSKYDLKEVEKEVNQLPDVIQLLSPEEYAEKFEEPEEFDLLSIINTILSKCKISSKLPFNETLTCSKVLSLITGGAFGTLVEGTNVLIYSFPLIRKLVLLKIHEGSSEMPDNEQEPAFIIEKKNGFFHLSSPYFELVFQIFDEDDPTIEENFEKLKLM